MWGELNAAMHGWEGAASEKTGSKRKPPNTDAGLYVTTGSSPALPTKRQDDSSAKSANVVNGPYERKLRVSHVLRC